MTRQAVLSAIFESDCVLVWICGRRIAVLTEPPTAWTLSAATALIVAAAELGAFRLHVGACGARGPNARKATARAKVR